MKPADTAGSQDAHLNVAAQPDTVWLDLPLTMKPADTAGSQDAHLNAAAEPHTVWLDLPLAKPAHTAGSQGKGEDEEEDENKYPGIAYAIRCGICLDPMHNPDMFWECGHTFCQYCIVTEFALSESWLLCPICRIGITNVPVTNHAMESTIDALVSAGLVIRPIGQNLGPRYIGAYDHLRDSPIPELAAPATTEP
ncbi:hypothetical protein C8R46DRAFT_1238063 [Mycena filopes]|nr:hypothetical protein C8R46DRAFT_1238063 [Mycena filopes]